MEASEDNRFLNPWRLRLIGVFLLSLIAFAPSLAGKLLWDDNVWFYHQPAKLADIVWGPTFGKFWRPLPALTFWLEHQISGVRPFVAHSINLLLHATTALVVVGIALIFTKRKDVSLLAGVLFAVQPAQIVPTGWIGGRNDLLCALPAALMIYGLLLWHRERRAGWLIASIVSYFVCMLSKENTVALLLAVPLIAIWADRRKDLKVTAPAYTAVAALFVVLWFTHAPRDHMGAYDAGRQIRFVLAGVVHYAALLTVPNPWSLSFYEPSGLMSPGWLALGAAILAGCVVFLWKAPRLYALLLAMALIAWLPNSNIVPIPSMPMAPYRGAVSGIFIAILLAATLRPVLAASFTAICLFLCMWHTGTTLNSSIPFFKAMVDYDPGFDVGWDNLSYAYLHRNRNREAVETCKLYLQRFAGVDDLRKPPDLELAKRRLDPCIGWRTTSGIVAGIYSRYGDALVAAHDEPQAILAYDQSLKLAEVKEVRKAYVRLKAKAAPLSKKPPGFKS